MAERMDPETGEIKEYEGNALEIVTPAPMSVYSAEIDVMIATSKRYPRLRDRVIADRIMGRATLSFEIASECLYNLSRAGKTIQGPSIRFAEIVRSCYGNLRVASRFVRIDADDRNRQAVICEAVALDTEMNDSVSAQVRRSIMTSSREGRVATAFNADMVNVTAMAAQAIATRNAILGLIPKAIWHDGIMKVEEVVRGTLATLGERRERMLVEFAKYEIKPEQIFAALGYEGVEDIGLNDLTRLAGMWTALKDGEAAESVLGMAIDRSSRASHTVVKNPMDNAPPSTQAASDKKPEPEKASATKSSEPPKEKKRGPGRPPKEKGEQPPADPSDPGDIPPSLRRTRESEVVPKQDEPEETRDRDAEAAQEDAEASSAAAKQPKLSPYEQLQSDIAAFSDSAPALMDWWRGQRDARATLAFEEQGHITKLYTQKFGELTARDEELLRNQKK